MTRSAPPLACLPALIVLALTNGARAPAGAQEVGVSIGHGFSDFREMESPTGLAIHGQLPVPGLPYLRVEAGYRWRWEDETRTGTTCDSYWPDFAACVREPIDYDVRLDQLELGLVLGVGVADDVELRAGVLRVRNDLDASSRGVETGRSTGSVYPGRDVWSTALVADAVWWSLAGRRLGIFARVRSERLDFGPCPVDVGAPFCGSERLLTVELGVRGAG